MSLLEIAFVAGSSLGGMVLFLLVWWGTGRVRARRVRAAVAVADGPAETEAFVADVPLFEDPDAIEDGDICVTGIEDPGAAEAVAVAGSSPDAIADGETTAPVDEDAIAALAVRIAALEAQVAAREGPSLEALAGEIEAFRSGAAALGESLDALADRLAVLEDASGIDVEGRVAASLETAMRRIGAMHGDIEAAVEARIAPLFGRLEAFEAERTVLMRTVNLEPMRAFAVLQVEVDALSERIASLSVLQGDRLGAEDDLPMPRMSGPGLG